MKKIYNIYSSFEKYGGAELILLSITKGLNKKNKFYINSFSFFRGAVNENYDIKENILYLKIRDIFEDSKNKIFLSHHRKVTSILFILKKIFFLKYALIHVAHNEFYSLRNITFLPRDIIAVSKGVKSNLINYFSIKEKDIGVIYNGIIDKNPSRELYLNKFNKIIKILYPARINKVKNQINLVNYLYNKLEKINIQFAGDGPQLNELALICKGEKSFTVLGYIKRIDELFKKVDYVLLYSKNEGLPTALIEAFMYGKPVICNSVGGNSEIVDNKINGFICNKIEDLPKLLNSLPQPGSEEYLYLCKNARSKYEEKFRFEVMINNYYEYLAKFI